MNCGSYRGGGSWNMARRLLKVLEGRIRSLVDFDEAQFGFMPGKGTTDALFLVRRLQKHLAKCKRMYMCFVDLEKAFD